MEQTKIPIRTMLLLAGVMLAVIVPFLLFGETIDVWTASLIELAQTHRLQAGLLLMLLLALDIVMPVPSSLVSTACGMLLGLWGGTLASFAGMTITTVAGYVIGRYASSPTEKWIGESEVRLLRDFHRRHGLLLLLAMRPVPVLAEASSVFSGISRLPFGPVLAVTAAGNLVVSFLYAAIGSWGKATDSFLPAFGASIALSAVLLLWMRRQHRKQ